MQKVYRWVAVEEWCLGRLRLVFSSGERPRLHALQGEVTYPVDPEEINS
jgi:hypothetical protein